MYIKKIEHSEDVLNTPGILGRRLLENDRLELVHLQIDPGKSLETHKLPTRVIFFVICGVGIITIEGESKHVAAGTCIECEENLKRSWKNSGPDGLKILVIKELD